MRAGIWAVHFGIDNEGHDSQKGMLRVIKDMELDVVGLLETDLHVSVGCGLGNLVLLLIRLAVQRTPFGHRDLCVLV